MTRSSLAGMHYSYVARSQLSSSSTTLPLAPFSALVRLPLVTVVAGLGDSIAGCAVPLTSKLTRLSRLAFLSRAFAARSVLLTPSMRGDLAIAAALSLLLAEKSFHFRHPSKSIKACMQPHSLTFRSSQTKFTGWGRVSRNKSRTACCTYLSQEVVAAGRKCFVPVALQ